MRVEPTCILIGFNFKVTVSASVSLMRGLKRKGRQTYWLLSERACCGELVPLSCCHLPYMLCFYYLASSTESDF